MCLFIIDPKGLWCMINKLYLLTAVSSPFSTKMPIPKLSHFCSKISPIFQTTHNKQPVLL
jgi:hypothetical protein